MRLFGTVSLRPPPTRKEVPVQRQGTPVALQFPNVGGRGNFSGIVDEILLEKEERHWDIYVEKAITISNQFWKSGSLATNLHLLR